mmetsp:Transcript_104460/g.185808  ORF Transcript_104460/g.185808 Transcript_104460/m.185808 type:complete len:209 (-) Transcript_104460:422-1048(-)
MSSEPDTSPASSKFKDFKSRCMTLRLWRKFMPLAVSIADLSFCGHVSLTSFLSCKSMKRVPPSQNSDTIKGGASPTVAAPMKRTRFGCLSSWRSASSRLNCPTSASRRPNSISEGVSLPGRLLSKSLATACMAKDRGASIFFTATSVPCHSALCTSAVAPTPTLSSIWSSEGLTSTQPGGLVSPPCKSSTARLLGEVASAVRGVHSCR